MPVGTGTTNHETRQNDLYSLCYHGLFVQIRQTETLVPPVIRESVSLCRELYGLHGLRRLAPKALTDLPAGAQQPVGAAPSLRPDADMGLHVQDGGSTSS